MVDGLGSPAGSLVLDVAAGTGSITRLLDRRGHRVVPLDQSKEMLAGIGEQQPAPVVATGERLPFPTDVFEAVTFGYLLRYVEDVPGCMRELVRVVRPGGRVGMVEFGRPEGWWRPWWTAYTRVVLPVVGRVIGPGWLQVGSFLGGSIDAFADRWPPALLVEAWEDAGLVDVTVRPMSVGAGTVMWGTKA